MSDFEKEMLKHNEVHMLNLERPLESGEIKKIPLKYFHNFIDHIMCNKQVNSLLYSTNAEKMISFYLEQKKVLLKVTPLVKENDTTSNSSNDNNSNNNNRSKKNNKKSKAKGSSFFLKKDNLTVFQNIKKSIENFKINREVSMKEKKLKNENFIKSQPKVEKKLKKLYFKSINEIKLKGYQKAFDKCINKCMNQKHFSLPNIELNMDNVFSRLYHNVIFEQKKSINENEKNVDDMNNYGYFYNQNNENESELIEEKIHNNNYHSLHKIKNQKKNSRYDNQDNSNNCNQENNNENQINNQEKNKINLNDLNNINNYNNRPIAQKKTLKVNSVDLINKSKSKNIFLKKEQTNNINISNSSDLFTNKDNSSTCQRKTNKNCTTKKTKKVNYKNKNNIDINTNYIYSYNFRKLPKFNLRKIIKNYSGREFSSKITPEMKCRCWSAISGGPSSYTIIEDIKQSKQNNSNINYQILKTPSSIINENSCFSGNKKSNNNNISNMKVSNSSIKKNNNSIFGSNNSNKNYKNNNYEINNNNEDLDIILFNTLMADDTEIEPEIIKTNNYRDSELNTNLHIAVLKDSPKFVEYFLCKNVDPNSKNKNGDTPLHLAMKFDNIDIIELLLEFGAKVNIKNDKGITPYDLASKDIKNIFKLNNKLNEENR